MTVNRKVTGTASTIPSGLAVGVLAAVVTMLTGTLIASLMIDREMLPWKHSGYAVMIILIISSWVGAVVAAEKVKRRRLLVCMAAGGLYFLILLVMTGLFFGGTYSGVGESALLILCGSSLGVLMKYPVNPKRNRRKIKSYHG